MDGAEDTRFPGSRAARRAGALYPSVHSGGTTLAALRERGEPRRVLGLLAFATPGDRESRDAYVRRMAASRDAAAMVRPFLGPEERALLDVAAGRSPGVPALLGVLPGGTEDERRYALEALAAAGAPETAGPLLALLADAAAEPGAPSWYPDRLERTVARVVHGGERPHWRRTPSPAVAPPAPGSVPLLLRYAAHPVPRARALALDLLGLAGDAAHLALFTAAARDPEAAVREAALVALGRTDHHDARDALAGVLTEPSRSLGDREIAAVLLGRAGDRRAFETLVLLLNHRDALRNVTAADTLARLGDPRTARAAAALATNRLRITYALAAIRLLGRLGAPESVPALTATLQWLLDEGRPGLQAARGCAEELGRLGDVRAVPLLGRAAGVPALRAPAVDALGRIGGAAVLDVLLAAAGDPDEEVRSAAARGLARYRDEPRATAALAGLCAPPYPRRVVRALASSGDPVAASVLARARKEAPSAATRRLAGRLSPGPRRNGAP
ncbi:HEAT repeat domain-containing protein [Streptomyces sp. MI02-7b]|nr:HEAT repeat domain-containing protein [Streptomyces sp. MI02-7b]MDX3077542.1 HEAT repeat domain-containing protein [Streptomyces sp. MI02-7b]